MNRRKYNANTFTRSTLWGIKLTKQQVMECSGPGECYPACSSLFTRNPYVRTMFALIPDADMVAELKETGAFVGEEERLQDRLHNCIFILWLSACAIREEKRWS